MKNTTSTTTTHPLTRSPYTPLWLLATLGIVLGSGALERCREELKRAAPIYANVAPPSELITVTSAPLVLR